MITTKRSLLLGTAVMAGLVGVGISQPLEAQENCVPEECDPFPLFGEKRRFSKEEFNAIAIEAADETVIAVLDTNGDLSIEAQDEIRKAAYRSFESMYQKFYILE